MKLSAKKSSATKFQPRARHSTPTPRSSLSTPLGGSNRPPKTAPFHVQEFQKTPALHARTLSDPEGNVMSQSDKFWYEQLLEVNNRLHAVTKDLDTAKSEAKIWKKKCHEKEAENRSILSDHEDKMKRLEIHYGQQLETLQKMHANECESILREIDNLTKTNEAFRKQLGRNGIAPVTSIPLEYEKHENGVLNEEHRAFIETAYRTIMLDTQDSADSIISSIERTAHALDYELKALKNNHAKLKVEKTQTDMAERNNQPAPMPDDTPLVQSPVSSWNEDADRPADRQTPTAIGIQNGLNDITRAQRQRVQTMDNLKKAIPSIFLRKSLERRKDSNTMYEHVDDTEDLDTTAVNRRRDRSLRQHSGLSDESSDSVDGMPSSRGTASRVAHYGERQDSPDEVRVTSSSSCDVMSPSKRMFTKMEVSTSLMNYETSRKFTSAVDFPDSESETIQNLSPAMVASSRVRPLLSETSSNGNAASTYKKKLKQSAPSHTTHVSRRSSDPRSSSRCSSPTPLSSAVVDQPKSTLARETSGSKSFVIAELELPQPSLNLEAIISSKSDFDPVVNLKESTASSPARSVSPEPAVVALQAPARSSSTGQARWAKRKQVLAVLQRKPSGLGLATNFVSDSVGKVGEGVA